jgi:hypothetical protein
MGIGNECSNLRVVRPYERESIVAPGKDDEGTTKSPQCNRCGIMMVFVVAILDPKTSDRVWLFQCPQCQNTAFIRA